MLAFCNTCSDFHMKKTGGHAKNLQPILPLCSLNNIKRNGEIFDSLCVPHPWIKLEISHLFTLSPSHLTHQPHHHPSPPPSPIFLTSPPSHVFHIANLTMLSPSQPHQPPNLTTFPPTTKALQNNNIRLSLSPHWFLKGGSLNQNQKQIHTIPSWEMMTAVFKLWFANH